MLAAGVDAVQLYDDHASGNRDDRPGLAACLKALRDGDTLVVWKLDRLGRNLHHLVNTVHDLTARGVGLKVLTGQGAAIDTTIRRAEARPPRPSLVLARSASLANQGERPELSAERGRAEARRAPCKVVRAGLVPPAALVLQPNLRPRIASRACRHAATSPGGRS